MRVTSLLFPLLVKKTPGGGRRGEKVELVDLADEFYYSPVGNAIVNVVGILAVVYDALVAQDVEMLGNVGV